MTRSVCPATTIAAPIDRVWALLTNPASYDDWWDATADRIVPSGPAVPGQVVYAHASFLGIPRPSLPITVEHIDPAKHRIDLTARRPLGITSHNHLACAVVTEDTTWLQFG